MKKMGVFVAGIALLMPVLSNAAGFVDARLVGSAVEIDDPFDNIQADGVGYELRGQVDFSPMVFGRVSYLNTVADETELNGVDYFDDFKTEVLRGGLGIQGANNNLRYFGVIEYVDVTLDIETLGEGSEDGFILSGGLGDAAKSAFLWNVELGLVRLDDSDGAVFAFDIGYRFNPSIAIVFGGQGYAFEDSDDFEYTISHGTLGVRVSF